MGGVLLRQEGECVIGSCRQTQPRPILDHQGRSPAGQGRNAKTRLQAAVQGSITRDLQRYGTAPSRVPGRVLGTHSTAVYGRVPLPAHPAGSAPPRCAKLVESSFLASDLRGITATAQRLPTKHDQ